MLLWCLFVSQPVNAQAHLDTARTYVGVKEKTGHNDGYFVEKFLSSVKRKKGDAWCAAFVSYCLTQTKVKVPTIRSGLARDFKLKNSIAAKDVLRGKVTIPPGTLIIWQNGTTITGHVGIVISWQKASGTTVEGNTSSGRKGSQADGDGVYVRQRTIQPGNYFRITSFTLVK